MSPIESDRGRRRAAFSLATAAVGALAAAMLSMGTAHATRFVDPYTAPDPYAALFGAQGDQGIADNNLHVTASTESGYQTFQTTVDAFESTSSEHGLENLIYAIDPSAFYEQTGDLDAGYAGTIIDSGGAYLVPDSTLGYLATGLDYGLLTPTGARFRAHPAHRHSDGHAIRLSLGGIIHLSGVAAKGTLYPGRPSRPGYRHLCG